jgi:hypothetical protein
MSPQPRPRRRVRVLRISQLALLVIGALSVTLDVAQIGSTNLNQPWLLAVAVLAFLVLLALELRKDEPPPPIDTSDLPHVDDLIGREAAVARVVEQVRAHGVVIVHGPSGIGTSSVAITAARLVPETPSPTPLYVDLSKLRPKNDGPARIPLLLDRDRWMRMPVLRILGLDLRASGAEATWAIADKLRGTGTVLVIDNVGDVNEVSWIADGVPGAYIIIAGEVATDELAGVADVPVQGLPPRDALKLLCRQADGPAQERPASRWAWLRPVRPAPSANSIQARVMEERAAASELATTYLQHPRVAVLLGRWLAQKPGERLSDLLHALRESGGTVHEIEVIIRRTLEGTSPATRRVLARLVSAPEVEYPDTAVAAMCRMPVAEAGFHLAALSRRFLVHRTSSRSRVTPPGVKLADTIPPREVARVHRRLLAHYATLARTNAALLGTEEYTHAERWFGVHDVALLALLGVRARPKHAADIADALDAWFVHEKRDSERLDAAEALLACADRMADATGRAVARIRMAAVARGRYDLAEAQRQLTMVEDLESRRTPWRSQLKTEWALCHRAARDPEAAYEDVVRAQRARPRRDLDGRMTDLINLGAIEVEAELYDPAFSHLVDAIVLARDTGSIAGHAHALELMGIGQNAQKRMGDAEDAWSEAEKLYRSIGDRDGAGRCERSRMAQSDAQV